MFLKIVDLVTSVHHLDEQPCGIPTANSSSGKCVDALVSEAVQSGHSIRVLCTRKKVSCEISEGISWKNARQTVDRMFFSEAVVQAPPRRNSRSNRHS